MRRNLHFMVVLLLAVMGALGAEVAPEEQGAVDEAATNKVSYKVPPNQILTFAVPLSTASRIAVVNSKNPPAESALAAIAVPYGFDPELPTPILIVGGSSDGTGSSIRMMPAYTNVALRLGWIVIAADGPHGKPAVDSPAWRWAMLSAVLDHVKKAWPGSERWPIACAGVSGGGKWAGVMGAILSQRNYNVVGVFMSGVNQDMASEAAKLYDPAIRYKRVPIFLSSGTDDKIATPQHHNEVKESLLQNGFTRVRLETFKGGHALSEEALRGALSWFIEQYGRGAIEPESSRAKSPPE